MKLIDVLNKIANGELKEGSKVIWGGEIYTYYGDDDFHKCGSEFETDLWEDMYIGSLNEEVELIELNDFGKADKMAEHNHFADDGKMAETNQFREDTKMIEELNIMLFSKYRYQYSELEKGIVDNLIDVQNKVNEMVRIINKRVLDKED